MADKDKKPRRVKKPYSTPKLIVQGSILGIVSQAWDAQALVL